MRIFKRFQGASENNSIIKDEGDRRTVIQVVILLGIFVAAMFVVLLAFSLESGKVSRGEAERQIIKVAEEHASQVYSELDHMTDIGMPFLCYLGRHTNVGMGQIVGMAEALHQETEAYAVMYVDSQGNGMLHDGSRVGVEDVWYHIEANQWLAERMEEDGSQEGAAVQYIYVPDDELKIGREAVLAAMANLGEDGERLYMYYPAERISSILRRGGLKSEEFCILMNEQGNIMSCTEYAEGFAVGDNAWDELAENKKAPAVIAAAKEGIRRHLSGSLGEIGGSRILVYAPVGINNWSVLVGVSEAYMDDFENAQWQEDMEMVHRLCGIIFIFLLSGLGIAIGCKARARKRKKEIQARMDTDPLTGLYNKAATERKIKEYMSVNTEEQGIIFIVDLDYFKKINDTLGHAFGDEVLRSFGNKVTALFRTSDIVGRIGGDEFVIFLKDLQEEKHLETQARKLCRFFDDFQVGEYVKYSVTASIGAAVYSKDGKDFDSLYKAADTALYMSKERGRNQIAFYNDSIKGIVGHKKLEQYKR